MRRERSDRYEVVPTWYEEVYVKCLDCGWTHDHAGPDSSLTALLDAVADHERDQHPTPAEAAWVPAPNPEFGIVDPFANQEGS